MFFAPDLRVYDILNIRIIIRMFNNHVIIQAAGRLPVGRLPLSR